jgi:hypothetical protein
VSAPPRRLVLIEGLPKSGKTTTADWLAEELREWTPHLWHESDTGHPIAIGWPMDAANVIRSCAASRYPFSTWNAFVATNEGMHIMEARFCQNAACFALLAGDDVETALSVSMRIARTVAPLRPLIVYLRVGDPETHASGVLDQFNDVSRAYLISAFDQQAWLTARGLAGEEGFAAAIAAWAAVADRVMVDVARIPGIDVLVVDAPERDWPAARERIRGALFAPQP